MKIFLDSSFFFPFIKIEVTGFQKHDFFRLRDDPAIILLRSELSLFELSAKGAKYVNEQKITIKDLVDGINTLSYDPKIQTNLEVVPINGSEIQILAADLRKKHPDFIDCLIVASAVYNANILLTFDSELVEKYNKQWKESFMAVNQHFEIILWKNYVNPK